MAERKMTGLHLTDLFRVAHQPSEAQVRGVTRGGGERKEGREEDGWTVWSWDADFSWRDGDCEREREMGSGRWRQRERERRRRTGRWEGVFISPTSSG
eukprot:scaffold144240_cov29-Tisochrysis_lutea.AAC.1